MAIVSGIAWGTIVPERPARTTWMVILGFALVHLVSDAFLSDPELLGQARRSQVIALVAAVVASVALPPRVAPVCARGRRSACCR